MTPRKDIITANPTGQSVPFVNVPHTSLAGLDFGELKLIIMQKTTKVIKLKKAPMWLTIIKDLVPSEQTTALRIKRTLANTKTCQSRGVKLGFDNATAVNIIFEHAKVRDIRRGDYHN